MTKNNSSQKYIEHFGINLNEEKIRLKLFRYNYALIDKTNYDKSHMKYIKENWNQIKQQKKNMIVIEDSFGKTIILHKDGEITHPRPQLFPIALKYDEENENIVLSNEYCIYNYKQCLLNYDLTMKYLNKLDANEFNKCIDNMLKKYIMVEIKDLNDCNEKKGIYVLILDEYKQVYIGQSKNIKLRILQHWKKKPKFDKILFLSSEESVISIDSYGALDTTRIYAMYIHDNKTLDEYEKNITKSIPNKFKCNRIGGGIHLDSDLDYVEAISTINHRNMK